MTVPPLRPGAIVAPGYEVIDHLSRGRTLDVYDVWSRERGSRAIAKTLRPDRRDSERARRHLLAEGRLLRGLSHPHIVRGYDVHLHPELVVVMETLRGETLAHLIERSAGPLEIADVAQLGLQLGSAVRYLHGRDILHLDLKPSNVVAEAGRAKLIDLSVARAPGTIDAGVGTWCYMAPEQAMGGAVGTPADVWGIGAVLFEAATGERAFDDPYAEEDGPGDSWAPADSDEEWTPTETASGPYPQLLERAPRVEDLCDAPCELSDLVAACLDPDPARRPPLPALLAGLEAVSDLPDEERRWTRGYGREPVGTVSYEGALATDGR